MPAPLGGAVVNGVFQAWEIRQHKLFSRQQKIENFLTRLSDTLKGPNVIVPEFALAQDHGIPTRLLDWTRNPLIAAFFAASLIDKDAKKIAVWAIHSDVIDDMFEQGSNDLKRIRHGKAEIDYLGAQEGVFIYDKRANEYYLENGEWRSFE
ncbi:MAG: FRG domain-containing protein, partial [Chloroflexi bacterium]